MQIYKNTHKLQYNCNLYDNNAGTHEQDGYLPVRSFDLFALNGRADLPGIREPLFIIVTKVTSASYASRV